MTKSVLSIVPPKDRSRLFYSPKFFVTDGTVVPASGFIDKMLLNNAADQYRIQPFYLWGLYRLWSEWARINL